MSNVSAARTKAEKPPLPPAPLSSAAQQARAVLKSIGLRGTAARLAVIRHMLETSGPLSHSEVCASLESGGFDSATIYRNLIELTRAGVLSRVDLGDHIWRFEKKRPARQRRQTHPHFVCDECGSVACLEEGDVKISGRRKMNGVAQVSSITVKGRCRKC